MMFPFLISGLLGLFLFSVSVDGSTKESINLRIYNSDFTTSNAEMLKKLEKADFESHGFKKEETRTMLSTSTNNSAYVTNLYYYKVVDCSEVIQVILKVEELLPGALGASVDSQLVKEMKDKKVDAMKKCKAGVEIHFPPDRSHAPLPILGRIKRSGCCCCCCGRVEAEV